MSQHGVALVTGASSGFGLLTVVEMAKSGFLVVATMRNPKKKQELLRAAKENGVEDQIRVYPLDVTDESAPQQVTEMITDFGRLDVLVNNAGFAMGGFVEQVSLAEWKEQFDTNFFGMVAVTQAALPFMRQAGRGRIINLSSISGLVGFPGMSPYVASKHAMEGFSESLRLEMKPFGVDVILIEPGSFRTNIWSSGKKVAEKSQNANSPYYDLLTRIEEKLEQKKKGHGNPQDVAKLIKYAATVTNPTLRYPIGKGVKQGRILKQLLPWKWWESVFLRQLKK